MNTSHQRPWQLYAAGAAIIASASIYLLSSAFNALRLSDHAGVEADIAAWSGAVDTAETLKGWLQFSSAVFMFVGVVQVIIGVMVWSGAHIRGTRVVALIYVAVGVIGSFAPLMVSSDQVKPGFTKSVVVFDTFTLLLAFVGCLLLFSSSVNRWAEDGQS